MKTFVFTVFTLVPGTTCHHEPEEVCKQATTFEEALALLSQTHPHHHIAKHLKGLWECICDDTK